jgi:hypothetical protein
MFKSILLAAAIVTGFVVVADAARYPTNGIYASRTTAATRFQNNWNVSY